jgi:general secretion pathway protein I
MLRSILLVTNEPPQKGVAGDSGFTLIEALVALCILAIAASAIMAATGAHVQRVARLQDRALAQLVAENRMAELRIAREPPASSSDRVSLGRQDWDVVITANSTNDPDLVDTKITVSAAGSSDMLLTLQGFVDAGGAQ